MPRGKKRVLGASHVLRDFQRDVLAYEGVDENSATRHFLPLIAGLMRVSCLRVAGVSVKGAGDATLHWPEILLI